MTDNTNPNAFIDAHAGGLYDDYRNVYYKIYANHNCESGQVILAMDPEREGVVC